MSPALTTMLASLALVASAAALPGNGWGDNNNGWAPAPAPIVYPNATVTLYKELSCAAGSEVAGTPFELKSGACMDDPSGSTYISANICLDGAVPKGYECKAILYSDPGCAGAGTATARLAKDQGVCYLKLTASSLQQANTVGGKSVGLVCPALADGSTIA
ncbi:hypothetical protein LTR78_008745 [Recurvomyces mirabilis]|uniref:Uncharacterized protein n=1 Tax=Recurvomyces mirabilis TaxID=574656 RepID=A0AAE0TUH2_9PEZI|nr:hypothetical protein LTR78_008745 [Recurvomyces mirabilis]KAK5159169.1 hypothetical protein LTS14_002311 [Recurvomyces mirabilis]